MARLISSQVYLISDAVSSAPKGVAKLVKALDFDSSMRGLESFLPCH